MTSAPSRWSSRSTPEWVTFGLSLLLLLVVVAMLAVQMLDGNEPAAPTATVVDAEIEPRGGRFVVPVEVTNEGDRGAQGVEVSAELVVGGETADASQTIDFLGAGEIVTLIFLFDDDPRSGELSATVDGFVVP